MVNYVESNLEGYREKKDERDREKKREERESRERGRRERVGRVLRVWFGSGLSPGLPGSGSGRVTRIRIGFILVLEV
jgi:hypothetical protein